MWVCWKVLSIVVIKLRLDLELVMKKFLMFKLMDRFCDKKKLSEFSFVANKRSSVSSISSWKVMRIFWFLGHDFLIKSKSFRRPRFSGC